MSMAMALLCCSYCIAASKSRAVSILVLVPLLLAIELYYTYSSTISAACECRAFVRHQLLLLHGVMLAMAVARCVCPLLPRAQR